MKHLIAEAEANYNVFSDDWKATLSSVTKALDGESARFLESYKRLISFQAWRSDLLSSKISEESLAFFLEAQNDILVSHVLARCGSWRSALKSLRSAIENVCFCLYYMDHPVELQQWHLGKHKPAFSSTHTYLADHPLMSGVDQSINPLPILQNEYSTLSRAVHASSKTFRMTNNTQGTLLWTAHLPSLGGWVTREKNTLTGLNLLLLHMFREHLQGNNLPNLRKAVSLSIPASKRSAVKSHLRITLYS